MDRRVFIWLAKSITRVHIGNGFFTVHIFLTCHRIRCPVSHGTLLHLPSEKVGALCAVDVLSGNVA